MCSALNAAPMPSSGPASFLLIISIACWMKGAFINAIASLATRSIYIVLMLVLVARQRLVFCRREILVRPDLLQVRRPRAIGNAFAPDRLKRSSIRATQSLSTSLPPGASLANSTKRPFLKPALCATPSSVAGSSNSKPIGRTPIR